MTVKTVNGQLASSTVSTGVEERLPRYIASEYPTFVQFLKAYYEWLEKEGNPAFEAVNLGNTIDIDRTADSFLQFFRDTYLYNIPVNLFGVDRDQQEQFIVNEAFGAALDYRCLCEGESLRYFIDPSTTETIDNFPTEFIRTSNWMISVLNETTGERQSLHVLATQDSQTAYMTYYAQIGSTISYGLDAVVEDGELKIKMTNGESNTLVVNIIRAPTFEESQGIGVRRNYLLSYEVNDLTRVRVYVNGTELNEAEYTISSKIGFCGNDLRELEIDPTVILAKDDIIDVTYREKRKVNERLLMKNMQEILSSKGTEESYRLMFRLLFNEEITIDYPGNNIIRLSDGKWEEDTKSLRISRIDDINELLYRRVNVVEYNESEQKDEVIGSFIVRDIFYQSVNNYNLADLFIGDIRGNIKHSKDLVFDPKEGYRPKTRLQAQFTDVEGNNFDISAVIVPSLTNIVIKDGGSGYSIGSNISMNSNKDYEISFSGVQGDIQEVPLNLNATLRKEDIEVVKNSNTLVYGSKEDYYVDGSTVVFTSPLKDGDAVTIKLLAKGAYTTVKQTDGRGTIEKIEIYDPGVGYTESSTIDVTNTTGNQANLLANGKDVELLITNPVDGEYSIGDTLTGKLSETSGEILEQDIQNNTVTLGNVTGEFIQDETIVNGSNIESSINVINLNIGNVVQYEGRYINTDGHISSIPIIQDGYKNQDFAYVIRSERTLDEYGEILKQVLHPIGFKMFGEIGIKNCISILIQNFNYTIDIGDIEIFTSNSAFGTEKLGPRYKDFNEDKNRYPIWRRKEPNTQVNEIYNELIDYFINYPDEKLKFLFDSLWTIINDITLTASGDADETETIDISPATETRLAYYREDETVLSDNKQLSNTSGVKSFQFTLEFRQNVRIRQNAQLSNNAVSLTTTWTGPDSDTSTLDRSGSGDPYTIDDTTDIRLDAGTYEVEYYWDTDTLGTSDFIAVSAIILDSEFTNGETFELDSELPYRADDLLASLTINGSQVNKEDFELVRTLNNPTGNINAVRIKDVGDINYVINKDDELIFDIQEKRYPINNISTVQSDIMRVTNVPDWRDYFRIDTFSSSLILKQSYTTKTLIDVLHRKTYSIEDSISSDITVDDDISIYRKGNIIERKDSISSNFSDKTFTFTLNSQKTVRIKQNAEISYNDPSIVTLSSTWIASNGGDTSDPNTTIDDLNKMGSGHPHTINDVTIITLEPGDYEVKYKWDTYNRESSDFVELEVSDWIPLIEADYRRNSLAFDADPNGEDVTVKVVINN